MIFKFSCDVRIMAVCVCCVYMYLRHVHNSVTTNHLYVVILLHVFAYIASVSNGCGQESAAVLGSG